MCKACLLWKSAFNIESFTWTRTPTTSIGENLELFLLHCKLHLYTHKHTFVYCELKNKKKVTLLFLINIDFRILVSFRTRINEISFVSEFSIVTSTSSDRHFLFAFFYISNFSSIAQVGGNLIWLMREKSKQNIDLWTISCYLIIDVNKRQGRFVSFFVRLLLL